MHALHYLKNECSQRMTQSHPLTFHKNKFEIILFCVLFTAIINHINTKQNERNTQPLAHV